jgi:hypothetical protein
MDSRFHVVPVESEHADFGADGDSVTKFGFRGRDARSSSSSCVAVNSSRVNAASRPHDTVTAGITGNGSRLQAQCHQG